MAVAAVLFIYFALIYQCIGSWNITAGHKRHGTSTAQYRIREVKSQWTVSQSQPLTPYIQKGPLSLTTVCGFTLPTSSTSFATIITVMITFIEFYRREMCVCVTHTRLCIMRSCPFKLSPWKTGEQQRNCIWIHVCHLADTLTQSNLQGVQQTKSLSYSIMSFTSWTVERLTIFCCDWICSSVSQSLNYHSSYCWNDKLVDKTISPQRPFSSCCGAFDSITQSQDGVFPVVMKLLCSNVFWVLLTLWNELDHFVFGSGRSFVKSEKITLTTLSAWAWRLQIFNREPVLQTVAWSLKDVAFTRQGKSNKRCHWVALWEM